MNNLLSYNLNPTASDPLNIKLPLMFLVPLLDRDLSQSLCCTCGKINGSGEGCNECMCGSQSGTGSGADT